MLRSTLRKFQKHMRYYLTLKNVNSMIPMAMLASKENIVLMTSSKVRELTLKIFLEVLVVLNLFLNLFLVEEGDFDLEGLILVDLVEYEALILYMIPH